MCLRDVLFIKTDHSADFCCQVLLPLEVSVTLIRSHCTRHLHTKTRLHSSRMRTARALTVSRSMLCSGGGGVCSGGCLLWGCLLRGVSAPGGVSDPGGACFWGVSAPGVSAPGGCGIPACTEADTPL